VDDHGVVDVCWSKGGGSTCVLVDGCVCVCGFVGDAVL
jgi:hypothetical protein